MAAPSDKELPQLLARWAEGKATLREVRGYTDEEMYAIARAGHVYFQQGQVTEARAIFQGLFALAPRDAGYARALGVVEWAAGNAEGALQAFDVAVKLDPTAAAGFVGRAEVRIAAGQRREARSDLEKAVALGKPKEPLRLKAEAMLVALEPKGRPA